MKRVLFDENGKTQRPVYQKKVRKCMTGCKQTLHNDSKLNICDSCLDTYNLTEKYGNAKYGL